MHNSFLAFLCLCFCTVLKGQALYGTSGLLHMPTADMQKDKTVMLGGNVLDKHPLSTYWNNKNYTYTYNYYINVTIFPWLEVAYTCTLVKGVKGNYWPEQTWGKFRNQDRNFQEGSVYGRKAGGKNGLLNLYWEPMIPEVLIIMVVVISILIKKLVLIIISIVFSGCNETFVFSECGGIRASYGLYL